MSARNTPPDELSSFEEEKLLRNGNSPNDVSLSHLRRIRYSQFNSNVWKFRGRNDKVIIQIYPEDHAKSCSVDEHPAYKRGTMMKPSPHPPIPLLQASSEFSAVFDFQCTEAVSEFSSIL
ncbi:hypothetical protein T12_11591 [Trichinella patagoniensis]|uniref:Uncharacterized protein n=1 Tax=Trichinella patagoniensis TaxID=990121 RepID=A0A0V0Z8I4_9BILA|nr:hypothetical protein T12_11591 [Trichinella patagoniensis]